MKLTKLDDALRAFNGQELKNITPATIEAKATEEIITRKTILLNCLGSSKPENGKEAITIYVLGTRLYEAEHEIDLDANELSVIKRAIDQNIPGYIPMIQGQVLQWLEQFTSVDRQ